MHDTTPRTTGNTMEDILGKFEFPDFPIVKAAIYPPNQSDADFISEYRHQLNAIQLRIRSDYDELQARCKNQSRRLDAIEGLLPNIHMQQQQIQLVTRELRALKRTVTDLQCAFEQQPQPLLDRAWASVKRALKI